MRNIFILFLLWTFLVPIFAVKLNCKANFQKPHECLFSRPIDPNDLEVEIVSHDDHKLITEVRFENMTLTVIPQEVFSKFEMMEILDVSKTSLPKIVPFENAMYLNDLQAKNNLIERLGANLFVKTDKLKKIDFSQNKIKEVDEGAFTGLKYLTSLSLNNNQIEAIKKNTFVPLTKLTKIDLGFNQITKISDNIFSQNHFIGKINLENNLLVTMTSYIFDGMKFLTTVSLNGNECTSANLSPTDTTTNLAKFKNDNLGTCFNDNNKNEMADLNAKTLEMNLLINNMNTSLEAFKMDTTNELGDWNAKIWTVFICFSVLFVVVITGTISTICVVAKLIANPQKTQLEKEEEDELINEYDDESYDEAIEAVVVIPNKAEKSGESEVQNELFRLMEQSKKNEPELIPQDDEEIYEVCGIGDEDDDEYYPH